MKKGKMVAAERRHCFENDQDIKLSKAGILEKQGRRAGIRKARACDVLAKRSVLREKCGRKSKIEMTTMS
jgi:hypothetical protein